MAVGLALALGFYFWKQNKASAKTDQSGAASATTTDSSLIPQFVNQTYVENAPPPAPPTPHDQPEPMKPGPPAQANQYPAPAHMTVSKLSNTSAKVNWDYVTSVSPKPTSYTIAVYQMNGKLAQYFTVNPDTKSSQGQATVTGLHPGWQYNVQVWANGGKVAPPGAKAKLSLLWLPGRLNR
jgi:hypothetical protein